MKKISKKLIIVKYGTNTLVDTNSGIDYKNINKHGNIINNCKNPIIIVSSGAVGFGKTIDDFNYIKDDVVKKRVLAAVGNPHLSIEWDKAIKNKVILQGLVTHKDFVNKSSRESLKNIIYNVYSNSNNAVIQINDNDFVTDEELRLARGGDFGDNDETSTLLAELCSEIFNEVKLVLNTSSDGVVKNGKTIDKLNKNELSNEFIKELCGNSKSDLGTGGMSNKLKFVKNLINKELNISVHIVNGKKPEQLRGILKGKSVGTKIC